MKLLSGCKELLVILKDFKYPLNYFSGKKGLEKEYESILRGGLGYKSVEIDAYGNEIKEISRKPPQRPENLYLSINKKLQLLARKELDGRKGAVIGIEPSTGLVKVLVSSPDYNPNLFNGTSTSEEITKILKDKDILNTELKTRSFFGDQKVVIIEDVTDRDNVYINDILETVDIDDHYLILTSGYLAQNS